MNTDQIAAGNCWWQGVAVRLCGAVLPRLAMVVVLGALLAGGRAGAQCEAPWLPGDGVVGIEGTVSAMVRLPGGDLIVGGNFTMVSNVRVSNIARYNPTTRVWSALGSGTNATVRALAAMANGDVIVGGDFTYANAPNTAFIARWNGSAWSGLGKGANLPVDALAVGPGGILYAGGAFTQLGTTPASHVAVWDGAGWAAMGSGLDAEVDALAVLDSGDVVAGGAFHASDAIPANAAARWDGSAWHQVGDGLDGRVRALAVGPDGRLYAGGSFGSSGATSCPRAAVFDGAGWGPMGAGTDGDVNALAIRLLGGGGYQVVAGGAFANADAVGLNGIGTYAGGVWSGLDGGVSGGAVSAVAVLNSGEIVAGGNFPSAGGGFVGQIGRWSGTDWAALSPGTNGPVYCSAKIPGGYIVGGDFTIIGGVPANRVAKWDGTHWSSLGKGMDASVRSLLVIDANNIYAGGEFRHADNLNAGALARWNGSTWAEVGGGVGGPADAAVYALARLHNGEIVVAGSFDTAGTTNQLSIARWDGATWKSLSGGITGGSRRVFALAVRDSGELLVGGNFTGPTLRIAMWSPNGWLGFGAGVTDPVLAILVLPGDSMVIGGQFDFAGGKFSRGVSAYDFGKSTWTNLGLGIKPAGGYVNALALDASGQLVIGGSFESVNNVPAANVARYGGGWAAVGAGFDGPVFTLAALSPLDLMAGGGFISSGSNISVSLAHWAPPDPPIIDASPVDAGVCGGGNASFSVAVSSAGTKVLKWQIEPEPFSDNWVDLTDGQYASTGTTIIGSDTDLLKVNSARPPLARRIRCRVSTDCTSFAVSDPAQLRVCSADLDCDGSATPADFLVWFAKWNATAAGADIDGVPGVDLGDFFEFLNSYDQGC